MKKWNKTYLLIFSLFINLLLLGVIGYSYYSTKGKEKYFDFIKHIEYCHTYSVDTTTVVLFVGNSITANWININSEFFNDTFFINKGLGGQSSTQMLLRFQHDVVSFKPSILLLNT